MMHLTHSAPIADDDAIVCETLMGLNLLNSLFTTISHTTIMLLQVQPLLDVRVYLILLKQCYLLSLLTESQFC